MMLQRLTILILICCLSFIASAQVSQKLFPYREGDKWGYCNRDGQVVITPQWDRADPFGHFSAKVMIRTGNESYYFCLVDEKGNYIIPPKLHWNGKYNINSSGDALNINDSNGHVGRVDTNGNIIIPMVYDQVGSIYAILGGDFYRVYQKGKQGVIRKNGSTVLPCKYDEIWHTSPVHFNPPIFLVKLNDSTSAVVDTNGKAYLSYTPILTPTFRMNDSNTMYFRLNRRENAYWLWEHYPTGQPRQIPYEMSPVYVGGNRPIEGIYAIMDSNGKYGIADPHCKVLVPPLYNEVYYDTGAVIIAEKRLNNGNPQERYEYIHLDTATLQPLSKPVKTARSAIEEARRREPVYDDESGYGYEKVIIEQEPDEDAYEPDDIIAYETYKVGDYLVYVNPETDNRQGDEPRKEYQQPITVYNTNKELLGYTLANDKLEFVLPPQPYPIYGIYIGKYNFLVTLEHEGRYALADSNLNILINFQDRYFMPHTYFTTNGKQYVITTYSNDDNVNWYKDDTRTFLVGADGKDVPGFEQYRYVNIMNNENLWGHTVTQLAVKDSAGMMGITDLQGKVLYTDVSFKHSFIVRLSDHVFKTSDKKGKNVTLVNTKNKNLFPGSNIWGTDYARPYYFHGNSNTPIPGIFIVYYNGNRDYFYMNDKGKPFMKNVDITAPQVR